MSHSALVVVSALAFTLAACCECDETDDGGAGGQTSTTTAASSSSQSTSSDSSSSSSTSTGGTCTLPRADCDGDAANGCEVDTDTDPMHCGACGAPCGIGSCVDGECVRGDVLADGLATLGAIVTDGARLYFVGSGHANVFYVDGAVYSMPIDGSAAPTTLLGPVPGAEGIIIDGDWLVFTSNGSGANNFTDGFVARLPRDGGASVPIQTIPFAHRLTAHQGAFLVAAAGTYPTLADGQIWRWDGAAISQIATDQLAAEGATELGDYVYWISRSTIDPELGNIRRRSIAGGAIESLADEIPGATCIQALEGQIYVGSDDKIFRIDPADPTTRVEIVPDVSSIAMFATDGTDLYWTQRNGIVARQALTGGPVVQLEQLTQAWGLQLYGDYVYVTDRGTGVDDAKVVRIHK